MINTTNVQVLELFKRYDIYINYINCVFLFLIQKAEQIIDIASKTHKERIIVSKYI